MEKTLQLLRSKWREYLIEMIVIIVGILLAIALNNWNEERKNRQKEKVLIQQIHKEFLLNKKQMQHILEKNQEMLDKCDGIIQMFPISLDQPTLDSVAQYLFGIGKRATFNPTYEAIDALRSTSSFELISDLKLREELIKWTRLFEDYKEQELNSVIYHNNNFFQPFLSKHIPGTSRNFDDPRFDSSILRSIEFENKIIERSRKLVTVTNGHENMNNVITAIDQIIELTKPKN